MKIGSFLGKDEQDLFCYIADKPMSGLLDNYL